MISIMRSLVLSFVMAVGLKVLFETFVSKRHCNFRLRCMQREDSRESPCKWVEYTDILAWTAGIMWIALSEIPPYLLQPVRLIIVIFIIAQIYYRVKPVQNLILSVLFCAIYWIVSVLVILVFEMITVFPDQMTGNVAEVVVTGVHLLLIVLFCHFYKRCVGKLSETKWERIGYYPVLSLIVIMAISMLAGEDQTAVWSVSLVVVVGFGVINIFYFYFVANSLKKEEEMHRLKLLSERSQNQMHMYQNMQKSYDQQRRYLHDYKNQLNCIQGMLAKGQTTEAIDYIAGLTGSMKKSADHVNTNHTVVNVVLNQKYHEAWEKDITMTMSVNDLSELTISEEDIVTLLVNLLDNAIEACEKLDENKVIRFKMVLEEGQLILSVKNPVKEPVLIKDKRVVTSKKDSLKHGIGLLNVDSVIKKNRGTSVVKCEDGWFYFSAMISINYKKYS